MSLKPVSNIVLAIIFGLFLQQLKCIFYAVDAKAYRDNDQRRSNVPKQPSYGQPGNQRGQQTPYESNSAIRYQSNSQQNWAAGGGGGNQWPEGTPLQCKSLEAIKTHQYSIRVLSKSAEIYDYLNLAKLPDGNSEIKICCPGYARTRGRYGYYCTPVCENCRNGRCIAPNQCECYDEFVSSDNNDCVFACPLGCLNGRCYLDGSCQCDPGYKLDPSRRFCRPICSKGCGTNPLINCTAPEVCGCISGYTLNDKGCEKVCDPDCGMGVCRHGVCDCDPGYTLKDGVCQSECYQTCNNGICYGPNRCICNPGFVYQPRTKNCIPKSMIN